MQSATREQPARPSWRIVLVVVIVWLASPSKGITASMDEILSAWRTRQSRAPSFRIHWTAEVTSLSTGTGQTVTHDQTWMFLVDGMKTRHESRGVKLVDNAFVDMPYTHTFDGERNFSHYGKGETTTNAYEQSIGFVDDQGFSQKGNHHLEPLILHSRILEPILSPIHEDQLTVSLPVAVLNGNPCLVLTQEAGGDSLTWDFWVDPANSFVVRRYSVRSANRVMRECDIEFEENVGGELWPTAWRSTLYFGGKFFEGVTANVQTLKLEPTMEADEFSYAFPVDTKVNERYSGRDVVTYLVREDGKRRIVTQEEKRRGASYAELLKTDAGKSELSNSRSFRIVLFVGAVLTLAPFLLFRRRKASGGQP